ncbi:S1C family serine protease [Cellulomonas sp.]|uniref:S1C family serine protease n=1 Tax=Cellulomonas sp. TaxID=40001 RepID=UPI002D4DE307|nr:trypsin-like peptidase domain-containing protein [Cellulomonas sp.]HYQ76327.1 trypsin-like peptidase domain-containing protein [Cellulomonas sp.]
MDQHDQAAQPTDPQQPAAPQPATPPQPAVDPAFAAAHPGYTAHPGDTARPGDPAAAPPAPRRSRRRRTAVALVASGAVAGALVLGGSAVALGWPAPTAGTGLTASAGRDGSAFGLGGSSGSTGSQGGSSSGSGSGYGYGSPSTGLPGPGSSGSSSTGTATLDTSTATEAQQQGVVLINTVLGYQSAEAAGSGVVLTSDGLVLTNNHVVEGATEITVTIGATGETYTAQVVGTDASADVAVLQLEGASGLTTATLDSDDDLAVGDAVTAVGNAEGGGVLLAADGTVTALDQSITTQAEGVSSGESLTGLIQVDADVVSGDSGGALLDDQGEVVGITTAASSGSADITGYAIPIDDALDVATQIIAGHDSDTITLGYPAFLGVQLATGATTTVPGLGGLDGATGSTGAGATIAGVIDGTPAAQAGLAAGDTVTAVDGTAVADGDALSAALAAHAPGDQVTLTWTATDGTTQTATVTLIAGPAD